MNCGQASFSYGLIAVKCLNRDLMASDTSSVSQSYQAQSSIACRFIDVIINRIRYWVIRQRASAEILNRRNICLIASQWYSNFDLCIGKRYKQFIITGVSRITSSGLFAYHHACFAVFHQCSEIGSCRKA